MYSTQNKKEKILLFLKIFFPILIYQFANYSASFIDTTMTGQYDTLNLAAVSMATSLWNPFYIFNWDCICFSANYWTASWPG